MCIPKTPMKVAKLVKPFFGNSNPQKTPKKWTTAQHSSRRLSLRLARRLRTLQHISSVVCSGKLDGGSLPLARSLPKRGPRRLPESTSGGKTFQNILYFFYLFLLNSIRIKMQFQVLPGMTSSCQRYSMKLITQSKPHDESSLISEKQKFRLINGTENSILFLFIIPPPYILLFPEDSSWGNKKELGRTVLQKNNLIPKIKPFFFFFWFSNPQNDLYRPDSSHPPFPFVCRLPLTTSAKQMGPPWQRHTAQAAVRVCRHEVMNNQPPASNCFILIARCSNYISATCWEQYEPNAGR